VKVCTPASGDSVTTITSTTTATTKNTQVSSASDAFSNHGDDGYYGTPQVEGYATIFQRQDGGGDTGDCGQNGELCTTVDYVLFHVTRNSNVALREFLLDQNGNSFAGEGIIGMGCVSNEVISYSNVSDSDGWKPYTISAEDTTKIMASTANSPIAINVSRSKLTTGGGAPTCYSHFATFTLAD